MRSSSFTFTRRYYNLARALPDKDRLAFYDMLLAYTLDGVEPEGSGMAQAIVKNVRPRTAKTAITSPRNKTIVT